MELITLYDGDTTEDENSLPPAPEVTIFQMRGTADSTPIIMRFSSPFHKERYLSHYYKHAKNLKLQDFGYTGDNKIFMNHNLSSNRYKAFKLALTLKKSKLVDAVRVVNYGDIVIKVAGSQGFVTANSEKEINSIIRAPVSQ